MLTDRVATSRVLDLVFTRSEKALPATTLQLLAKVEAFFSIPPTSIMQGLSCYLPAQNIAPIPVVMELLGLG